MFKDCSVWSTVLRGLELSNFPIQAALEVPTWLHCCALLLHLTNLFSWYVFRTPATQQVAPTSHLPGLLPTACSWISPQQPSLPCWSLLANFKVTQAQVLRPLWFLHLPPYPVKAAESSFTHIFCRHFPFLVICTTTLSSVDLWLHFNCASKNSQINCPQSQLTCHYYSKGIWGYFLYDKISLCLDYTVNWTIYTSKPLLIPFLLSKIFFLFPFSVDPNFIFPSKAFAYHILCEALPDLTAGRAFWAEGQQCK